MKSYMPAVKFALEQLHPSTVTADFKFDIRCNCTESGFLRRKFSRILFVPFALSVENSRHIFVVMDLAGARPRHKVLLISNQLSADRKRDSDVGTRS